jgi:hypothetical protein
MTQNVDLQVKVKFIVDPKDLQAALSGGGSSASAGSSGSPGGHVGPGGPTAPGQGTGRRAGGSRQSQNADALSEIDKAKAAALKYSSAMQAYQKEYQKQLSHLPFNEVVLKKSMVKMQAIGDRVKRMSPEFQKHFDEVMTDLTGSIVAGAKAGAQEAIKKAANAAAGKGPTAARVAAGPKPKVGKGFGSEGMFAAGTSPIMQGLAWQSLFATGDILGPMSFAPMALYQNYSLKRQRRNRGFDLGAGSDLAKAAGVGDTGQIATAGHALAAIRRNQALSPEEREKRMAQVDIMSAGRVRGRLGRGIEMFEAGQVGGGAVRALGGVVGAIGGVASVATGAVAGVGALVMALNHLDDRMKDSVNNIRAITDSMEEARRTQRRSEQMEFEGGMAGSQGTDLSVLERAGLSGKFTPQMRSGLAKIGRAAGPEKMKALVGPMLQAARMFDLQPEDVLGDVLQSGAYRQPTERMLARMPLILANSVKAIPARRREMRAMWAKRTPEWTSSGTAFGDMAESSRSAAAYAEGAKLDRGMGWDATRKAEIKRLEEEAAKLPLGNAVGRETLNMKIKSIAQPEGTLTRSLANDPLLLQKQDMYAKNTLALEKLTEQLQKSSPMTKGLSAVAGEVTGGLWETQSAKRERTLYEQKFAEWVVQQMRQMGAGDRQ